MIDIYEKVRNIIQKASLDDVSDLLILQSDIEAFIAKYKETLLLEKEAGFTFENKNMKLRIDPPTQNIEKDVLDETKVLELCRKHDINFENLMTKKEILGKKKRVIISLKNKEK